ncbi:hypothetical protein [Spirosoma koreense]
MKQIVQRDWRTNRQSPKGRGSFDYTTALGSLTVALFAYIVYHIYPLLSKGLLW